MDLPKIDFNLYNKYDKNKNSYIMNVDTLPLLEINNLLMFGQRRVDVLQATGKITLLL
jgi:hypothetical protein